MGSMLVISHILNQENPESDPFEDNSFVMEYLRVHLVTIGQIHFVTIGQLVSDTLTYLLRRCHRTVIYLAARVASLCTILAIEQREAMGFAPAKIDFSEETEVEEGYMPSPFQSDSSGSKVRSIRVLQTPLTRASRHGPRLPPSSSRS
jgi:hypothetical protein